MHDRFSEPMPWEDEEEYADEKDYNGEWCLRGVRYWKTEDGLVHDEEFDEYNRKNTDYTEFEV